MANQTNGSIRNIALDNLKNDILVSAKETASNIISGDIDTSITSSDYSQTNDLANNLKKYLNYQTSNDVNETFSESSSVLSGVGDSDSKTFWDKLQNQYQQNKENSDQRVTSEIMGSGNSINSIFSNAEAATTAAATTVISELTDIFSSLTESGAEAIENVPLVGSLASDMMNRLSGSIQAISGAASTISLKYNDGSTETAFGQKQESSWRRLVQDIKNRNINFNINRITTTPLDSGDSQVNLYGTMMLGCPPSFLPSTDPLNRGMINSFVKDSCFVSLTPGMPKYNGSRYLASTKNSALNQTQTSREMIDYLVQNGVNKDTLSKDKRYYVFESSFGKFYSYLETMLNTVWIKLGLGTEDNNTFNMFSFFPDFATNDNAEPEAQYKSAIGFYINPNGAVTENITNERTAIGADLASKTNNFADQYQQLGYLTGMGTGGAGKNLARTISQNVQMFSNIKDFASNAVANMINGWKNNSGIVRKAVGAVTGAIKDYVNNVTTEDMGAVLQSYTAVNGMQVVYPELWRDSAYSQAINIDFNFTSPYGDPLSIFKYVYVPFFTLLCFTMPRQADDNGYVSPFLVRADIPGMATCDLGYISNLSYTRGGSSGLFTKDGLPRAISGNFTIESLYPYLAMSRRISFLSANPSYTSFLDSMTGFAAVYSDESDSSSLNEYFKNMLNRVNGESNLSGVKLWNRFDSYGRSANKKYVNTLADSKLMVKPKNIHWLRKV